MAYYKQFRECPYCRASLDANEKCDCQDREYMLEEKWQELTNLSIDGQLELNLEKEEVTVGDSFL